MELITYLLKVSACTVLFFAFYLLVLRRLTFFKINRFYLLITLLLSFVIPALNFTIEREVAASEVIYDQPTAVDNEILIPQPQTPIQIEPTPTIEGNFDWYSILPQLYFGIVACLLIIATWRILQLVRHTKNGAERINGLKIVSKTKGFTNCSFFNYVFIDNENLSETELQVLLKHEQVHAKQLHSIDKVILIVVKAFLWFNPVVYLYDKALEQAHEYEADEATSQSFGTAQYANLLLRLAIEKSEMPLVHNFVKSPIKERIQMLFNHKSKNMKKLMYLLALPIGLGLIWGFTVKITHRVKPITQQKTAQLSDTLSGKTVRGEVKGFEKSKLGEVLNLEVGGTMVRISCYNFKDKVKVGDEISVTIGGRNSGPPPPMVSSVTTDVKGNRTTSIEKAPYIVSKVIGANGKIIYELAHYAFGYEVNKARYASSIIKSIDRNSDGTIEQIVLKDKNGFTINLNLKDQKFKTKDFKEGSPVIVKFFGEKLVAKNTYTTDKMIVLYSQPKKYELKNKTLFDRFYYEDGRQKIKREKMVSANVKTSIENLKPILLSSTSLRVDTKTDMHYISGGRMQIGEDVVEAENMIWDKRNGVLTTAAGTIKYANRDVISGRNLEYDFKKGTAKMVRTHKYVPKDDLPSKAYQLISKLKFNTDSIKIRDVLGDILLTGNVKLNIDNYSLDSKIVKVERGSNVITSYLGSIKNPDGTITKADVIELDVITKKVTTDKKLR